MNRTRRSTVRGTSAASQRRAVKKFIKIILLSTIERKMMMIPPRFVRFGPKLSDIVTIKTPAGFKCWIRIKRIGEEVWFEKGWSEFAEAHSLGEGHFLFFHYKGNSSFHVVIFDVSASEIEYPLEKVCVIGSDDDEVIDLEELLKKKQIVSIKSQKFTPSLESLSLSTKKPIVNNIISDKVTTIVDVEEIDSMDEPEEDERLSRRIKRRF